VVDPLVIESPTGGPDLSGPFFLTPGRAHSLQHERNIPR
jgi:hypothetical protein